jgi:peptidoglycan/xylan/chitin deacetylase (PgdA/CDA1 family)
MLKKFNWKKIFRRKPKKWWRRVPVILIVMAGCLGVGWLCIYSYKSPEKPNLPIPELLTPTIVMPSPTQKAIALTFSGMIQQYGPCTQAPTLMYHHIQPEAEATQKGQKNLSVFTSNFQSQMNYLKDKGYNPISMRQLTEFFDTGAGLPPKPVLLTFDDAYQDFFTDAYPILRDLNFPATLFVPTGLVDNPDYVTWGQIEEMKGSGLILFANHTWSHHSMKADPQTDTREITTADQQLNDKGLNNPKVFAYPYGGINVSAQKDLVSLNYQLAFTTQYGKILCKGQRYILPRVRVGNVSLSSYGL